MEVMVFLGVLLGLYFVPTIVAVGRRTLRRGAIITLNLLLGWTLLGWVGALIWAMADTAEDALETAYRRACPFCAEAILPAAVVCPHCQRELPDRWALHAPPAPLRRVR